MTILALLATSALTFWFSALHSAKVQLEEIEELRVQAEAQEVSVLTKQSLHFKCPSHSVLACTWQPYGSQEEC